MPADLPQFDGTKIVPSPGFDVPVKPATKTLMPHQAAALETTIDARRVVMGLPAGTGKTLVAQSLIAAELQYGGRALCLVPPSLSISPWYEEFSLDFGHLSVYVAQGGKPQPLPDVDVVIMSDAILAKRLQDCIDWEPSIIVGDEAHRYKNQASQRTKAVVALSDSLAPSDIVAMMTGTLADNSCGDVYTPLRATSLANANAVAPGGTWSDFLDNHCETEIWFKQRVVTGCQDAAYLHEKLTSTCMIAVDKTTVLDLPAKTPVHTKLNLSGKAFETYRYAQKHFLSWVQQNFGDKAMESSARAEAMTKLMRLWELDGLAKVPAAADYVESLFKQGEATVVMAWHASVVVGICDELTKRGIHARMIKGGVSSQEKANIVSLFQEGAIDVVVGQIISAGTGLTLTAARHLVFAQLPWSPGSFSQASDRVWRIGQDLPVFIHMLTGADCDGKPMVSDRMCEVIKAKAIICDEVNYGKTGVTIDAGSVITQVLDSFIYG